jgi:MOSC domain-containing protein YiiM
MEPVVIAVARSATHTFTKPTRDTIRLTAGLGVDGDAHQGVTVKHRSRVARDPSQPNLRQVHLIHAELLDEVAADGFDVPPGGLGENVLTRGIDLLGLSTGTVLRIGQSAVIRVTGLRNPCLQIDAYADGLLAKVVGRDEAGNIVRRAGIMGVVEVSGDVAPGDLIAVEAPTGPHRPLEYV